MLLETKDLKKSTAGEKKSSAQWTKHPFLWRKGSWR